MTRTFYSDERRLNRTAIAVWMILCVGTILFAAMATTFFVLGMRQEQSLRLTLPIVGGLCVLVLIVAHRHDFMRTKLGEMWKEALSNVWYWSAATLVLFLAERSEFQPTLKFDDPTSMIWTFAPLVVFVYFLLEFRQRGVLARRSGYGTPSADDSERKRRAVDSDSVDD